MLRIFPPIILYFLNVRSNGLVRSDFRKCEKLPKSGEKDQGKKAGRNFEGSSPNQTETLDAYRVGGGESRRGEDCCDNIWLKKLPFLTHILEDLTNFFYPRNSRDVASREAICRLVHLFFNKTRGICDRIFPYVRRVSRSQLLVLVGGSISPRQTTKSNHWTPVASFFYKIRTERDGGGKLAKREQHGDMVAGEMRGLAPSRKIHFVLQSSHQL